MSIPAISEASPCFRTGVLPYDSASRPGKEENHFVMAPLDPVLPRGLRGAARSKYKRTKIVCTIGPATSSTDQIRRLILEGMDVARLNFSHGDHNSHREILRRIRETSKELGRETGVLQDLTGPKIRLGELPFEEQELRADEIVVLSPKKESVSSVIPVNYPHIVEDVAVGDRILLADGLVELKVEDKTEDRIICRVVVGGVIHSHKGVNLPTSHIRVPAFTEKDREDLALGIEEDVDFVALSFVRHKRDLEPIQEMLAQSSNRPLLIAKI